MNQKQIALCMISWAVGGFLPIAAMRYLSKPRLAPTTAAAETRPQTSDADIEKRWTEKLKTMDVGPKYKVVSVKVKVSKPAPEPESPAPPKK